MPSHIKAARSTGLPDELIRSLVRARRGRGWSQRELGSKVGLPQVHISAIETGKVVPRYDTLLELVRVLGYDLLLVPRALVPAVQALVRDHEHPAGEEDRPLYGPDAFGDADES
jgi:HTH-type transcriptional regulator / antitoxin HipB